MERDETSVRVARRGSGYVAEAARFYLWDEDAGTLLRAACDLARAAQRAPRGGVPRWTVAGPDRPARGRR